MHSYRLCSGEKTPQLQHVCLSVLLQMLMHANLQHVCRSVLLQLLTHANLQHDCLSVLLQMLMHANLPRVCLSVLANACKLATCLSLSTVACTVSLAKAKTAVFLVNMPNMPAKPHFTIQIRMAHSSAPPN